MNTPASTNRHAATGLRTETLDPVQAAAVTCELRGLLQEFPLTLQRRVLHVARLADGTVAGAALLGTAWVAGSVVTVGRWPCVDRRHASCQMGGLQIWEILLRAQLWSAMQHQGGTMLLAAPARELAHVFHRLEDVGAAVVRAGVVPELRLPRDWALVRVEVQAGAAALRAKRLAKLVPARFTLPADRQQTRLSAPR